ncbi:hypothetical protein LOAG_15454, partial [Loa loa]
IFIWAAQQRFLTLHNTHEITLPQCIWSSMQQLSNLQLRSHSFTFDMVYYRLKR